LISLPLTSTVGGQLLSFVWHLLTQSFSSQDYMVNIIGFGGHRSLSNYSTLSFWPQITNRSMIQ
jgi:hypothetical protein